MPAHLEVRLHDDGTVRVDDRPLASIRLAVTSCEAAAWMPIDLAGGSDGSALVQAGDQGGWHARLAWRPLHGNRFRSWEAEVTLRWQGEASTSAAFRLTALLPGVADAWWLIPGLFYGENRPEHCTRLYPRYDLTDTDKAHLTSSTWAFRTDRGAVPAVFAQTEVATICLETDEVSSAGLNGLGFAGGDDSEIWLDFPYREEPVTYLEPGQSGPADRQYAHWQPGEERHFRARLFVSESDRHGYDPVLRAIYAAQDAANPLNPWVGLGEAGALAAHGLHRWHYKPADAMLAETVPFDREGGKAERLNMHVAWVSGAPYAAALLEYGRRNDTDHYVEAGAAVLDKIAGGLAPCGAFWGEWRHDRGWSSGWSPRRGWLHPRTLGEATLFMHRAWRAEAARGHEHPTWAGAVRSNLDYVTGIQADDGNLGGYYDAQSGEVVAWEGAGGLSFVAALAEAGKSEGRADWLAAAERAGAYYERFVLQEFIHGAPEDVHLAPTSEDGYAAVLAYLALHEATGAASWLDLARRAADWTFTFRLGHNLAFAKGTFLGQYDFRSRGSDIASPSNQHLHAYGLIATAEMLRLADLTGDRHYLERTRDNIACFLQFIAREDGDFNAYKGMASERFYNTNCFQPKGMMLTMSHAWSIGMVLIASLAASERAAELGLPE